MISKFEHADEVELVIVGAGFAGLAAAKTYLQCAPTTDLVVLDANQTLGGTWAEERLYPEVSTNNLYGTFEYPDFPLHEGYGVKPGEHIPGHVVHKYLCDYSDFFKITPTIRPSSKATVAEKLDDGKWKLQVVVSHAGASQLSSYTLITSKLILATGLTSQPESIYVNGQENFKAPIINSLQLPQEGVLMLQNTPPEKKHITVMGGGKSAYDAVYIFAERGFKVNWVIRKSGHGPTWMTPPSLKAGFTEIRIEDVPATRAFSWLSPTVMGRQDSYTSRFLHGTLLGNRLVSAFYDGFGSAVTSQTGLKEHQELQKLIPEERVFWYATSLAILNYEHDIHSFIRSGRVSIYREDIKQLSPNKVDLVDGTQLPSPAGLVTTTAWRYEPNIDIQPKSLRAELGIPGAEYTVEQAAQWNELIAEADEYILNTFPMLAQGPSRYPHLTTSGSQDAQGTKTEEYPGSYRLFRCLAPPSLTAKTSDRSIAFQGYMVNLRNHTRNEITALWIYAYMNNKLGMLDNPSRSDGMYNKPEKIMQDTAVQSQYWKHRFPWGFGGRFPDMTFEQVAYNDVLMTDLGLDYRRKKGWFWWARELFEPYEAGDYRGITQEWLTKN